MSLEKTGKDPITTQLSKRVLIYYLIIAVAVTAAHLWAKTVFEELSVLFIIANAVIMTIAMLVLVLLVSRALVSRPLERLQRAHDELKSQANRLEQNRRQFQDIIDYSPAVIFVKNTAGRYILVNSRYESLFHITKKEILGKTDHEVFEKQDADAFAENDRKVVDVDAPITVEETVKQDDGAHTYVSVKFPIHDAEGDVTAVCGISTDVSESKKARDLLQDYSVELSKEVGKRTAELRRMNQQLRLQVVERERAELEMERAKEQADQANQAKSNFLANMSHEIRTPMNVIMGMAHLALRTELTDAQRDYLEKIQVSSKGLLEIINEILDFSKIEAGKLNLEQVSFNPHHLLEEVTSQFHVAVDQKDLELELEVGDEVPAALVGDPLRVGQVLSNLISNATKFTHEGRITVRAVLDRADADQAEITFSVEDTGIGIEDETKSKLFDAFTQADGSTTRMYGGSGLGLAICRNLVGLMGGQINIESTVGVGSTFSCSIAFQRQKEMEETGEGETAYRPTSLRGASILVAEDEEINRMVLEEILIGVGAVVHLTANGREAVDALKKEAFDAVLMDLQMPEMDGYEATHVIRSDPQLRTLPIIATTAHALVEEKERCLEAGMTAYLPKPIDIDDLLATVWGSIAPGAIEPSRDQEPSQQKTDLHRWDSENLAVVRPLLVRLAELLEKNSFEAKSRFAQMKETLLGCGCSAEVEQLSRQINALDFKGARATLRYLTELIGA